MPDTARFRALAVLAIKAERRRQVEVEGWSPDHDDSHDTGELRRAAAAYLRSGDGKIPAGELPDHWPWDAQWWRPSTIERDLVKAGALSDAEEDRLLRGPFFLNRDLALRSIVDLRSRAVQRLAILYRDRDEQELADA